MNAAVFIIFAVEILRSVAHSVTGVPNNRHFHLSVVWETQHFPVLLGGQGRFLRLAQVFVLLVLCYVLCVKLRLERIDIKEWVFPVVNLSRGHPVERLETLVANGWKVHVGSLLGDLDSLEPII